MDPLPPSELFALVSFAATGQERAFAELVARFQDMAVGYAFAVLRDRAAAEDAAQDAFLDAWRSLAQLREPAAFPGWLRRIVFKHCDRRRRRAERPEVPIDERDAAAAEGDDAARLRALERAVLELPEHEREAVALFSFAGRSVASTAAFLGISETAVKNRLHEARRRLRALIDDALTRAADEARPSARPTFLDNVMRMIRPDDLASDAPHGPWSCRGTDIWDAIVAAVTGDAPALRRLLAKDPNLARAEYWYTQPLHFAVREGHVEAARALLDAGAAPDAIGHGADPLLTMARDRGHEAVARLLEEALARGTRAASDHEVHAAAAAGDVARLRALLDADPTLVARGDSTGGTPLHEAVAAGQRDAAALLLDRGADVHARHGMGTPYAPTGFEPIDLALWNGSWYGVRGDIAMARLLIERGATHDTVIAAALGDDARVSALLDADPRRIDETRPAGKRALSAAVQFGHRAIARLLLARGADPLGAEGAVAPRGQALWLAAQAGDQEMVELLLARGADPNSTIDSGGTPTWIAKTPGIRALLRAHGGELDVFSLIFLHEDDEAARRVEADPRAALEGCGTAFAAACTFAKRALVERMLAAGARVPEVVTGCRSYLWEDPDCLALLLASGMSPDLPDWQRATPLHDVCSRDGRGRPRPARERVAAMLLDAGATISARDEEWRSTPLAWAARNGLPEMVELLLARGAPPELPDDEPWATPLAWATRRGHEAIAERLRRAGARR